MNKKSSLNLFLFLDIKNVNKIKSVSMYYMIYCIALKYHYTVVVQVLKRKHCGKNREIFPVNKIEIFEKYTTYMSIARTYEITLIYNSTFKLKFTYFLFESYTNFCVLQKCFFKCKGCKKHEV